MRLYLHGPQKTWSGTVARLMNRIQSTASLNTTWIHHLMLSYLNNVISTSGALGVSGTAGVISIARHSDPSHRVSTDHQSQNWITWRSVGLLGMDVGTTRTCCFLMWRFLLEWRPRVGPAIVSDWSISRSVLVEGEGAKPPSSTSERVGRGYSTRTRCKRLQSELLIIGKS